MEKMSSAQIRREFLTFFEQKGHLIVQSAPVVPRKDPSLLFTNAGMNQFKPIFLSEQSGIKKDGKLWKRAADTQRCIRVSGKHNDLEEVGRDTYHHTFFEMLGNWSFGNYFKKEAVAFAWELLVEQWGMEPDRLYATIFEGSEPEGLPADKEAYNAWKEETGINPMHILEGAQKDNFWEMGETGPCGPCSEVHIDMRPQKERGEIPGAELVNKNHPKVIEIWNLVFIQFDRQLGGSLKKLPARHVDTGMGFERMCAILQGEESNYDTDLFKPLLEKISSLANIPYKSAPQLDIAMQVIADHIRSVSFAIADGAAPSNEGRGYVVRRILRRAVRYGWDKLNLKQPFFHKLVPVLAAQFKDVFPVLVSQQEYIVNIINAEEKSFLQTLGLGIELFNQIAEGKTVIPGESAFKLHDTYGFPIDLTQLMARERGLKVDHEGFQAEMQKQKQRGRKSGTFKPDQTNSKNWTRVNEGSHSAFTGYDELQTDTRILASQKNDDHPSLILEKTPFYAESGGQVADTGVITNDENTMNVLDVQKSELGFVHTVDRLADDLSGEWHARVDRQRRWEIRKHHTATHLLHEALRRVLGDHTAQKGSLVDENHLRFDFSHYEPVSDAQLNEIERMVNRQIQRNIKKIEEREVPIKEAEKRGARMLFGEKYGEKVRIITFEPGYSVELCGGTHVDATGEIGYFRLLNESSAAAGIRRIEAVTGKAADEALRDEKNTLKIIKNNIGASGSLAAEVEKMVDDYKKVQKDRKNLQQQLSSQKMGQLINQAEQIGGGVLLVTGEIPQADMPLLKQLCREALDKSRKGAITILGSKDSEAGKVYLAVGINKDIISQKGLKAGELARMLGKKLGGGGGGQPDLATAGGSQPEKLDEVLHEAKSRINKMLDEED